MRFRRTVLIATLASVFSVSPLCAQIKTIGTGLDTMVLVPAGYFIRGSTSEEVDNTYQIAKKLYSFVKRGWFEGEMPQRRIYLDAFYIDKYPVTNSQFLIFGKPKRDYGSKFNGIHQPVVGVTWYQARDYCKSVEKRLPTEAEWEKAARGVNGHRYPWGNQWDGSKVIWDKNSGSKTHPVDRTYNTHRSPYGAVDMAGNTWEWTADWYKGDYYRNAPDRNPKGSASGNTRVGRGGSWGSVGTSNFRTAYRDWRQPSFPDIWLSFRCAKTP